MEAMKHTSTAGLRDRMRSYLDQSEPAQPLAPAVLSECGTWTRLDIEDRRILELALNRSGRELAAGLPLTVMVLLANTAFTLRHRELGPGPVRG
jgi:hypothetical protein